MVTTLDLVKIDNGYALDLIPRRLVTAPWPMADGLCIVHPTERKRANFEQATSPETHPIIQWIQTFVIQGHIRESNESDRPIDDRLQEMAAEIERVLAIDETRGGLAMRTMPIGGTTHLELQPAILELLIDVHYNTFRSDPRRQNDF